MARTSTSVSHVARGACRVFPVKAFTRVVDHYRSSCWQLSSETQSATQRRTWCKTVSTNQRMRSRAVLCLVLSLVFFLCLLHLLSSVQFGSVLCCSVHFCWTFRFASCSRYSHTKQVQFDKMCLSYFSSVPCHTWRQRVLVSISSLMCSMCTSTVCSWIRGIRTFTISFTVRCWMLCKTRVLQRPIGTMQRATTPQYFSSCPVGDFA